MLSGIRTKKALDDDLTAQLKAAIAAFKPLFRGRRRWPRRRALKGRIRSVQNTRKITQDDGAGGHVAS